jgi:hypothetical protein
MTNKQGTTRQASTDRASEQEDVENQIGWAVPNNNTEFFQGGDGDGW